LPVERLARVFALLLAFDPPDGLPVERVVARFFPPLLAFDRAVVLPLERPPFFFCPFRSAMTVLEAVGFARSATPARRPLLSRSTRLGETCEQLFALGRVLLVADHSRVVVELELQQLATDPRIVIELAFSLVGHLLGDPGRAPDGRERQRHEGREQAHRDHASPGSSTKL
jgi:hypothetical protein